MDSEKDAELQETQLKEMELIHSSSIELTESDQKKLEEQNKRLVKPFKAQQLELNAQRHWDLFYKRNEVRFFKDRHWTTREFEELLMEDKRSRRSEGMNTTTNNSSPYQWSTLLEVGCGVGNFLYPLIQQLNDLGLRDRRFYACDFSPRAIGFMRTNPLYEEDRMKFFQCDLTDSKPFQDYIAESSMDLITMIFVLSAISPEKFIQVLKELYEILRPGGLILFRDYGRHDMTQLRFKPGHKIADNFYMRQDGTRSYFFSIEELTKLFQETGFEIITNDYIHSRTRNIKESIDVQRIFVQGKFRKKELIS